MPSSDHIKSNKRHKSSTTAFTVVADSSKSTQNTRKHPRKRLRKTTIEESEQEKEEEVEEGVDVEEAQSISSHLSGSWYRIREIIAERPGYYKVLWEGIDPQSRKPWPPDWVKKQDVTTEAIVDWDSKRLQKHRAVTIVRSASREHSLPAAGPTSAPAKRTLITVNDSQHTEDQSSAAVSSSVQHTQLTSDYQPSPAVATPVYKSTQIQVSTTVAQNNRKEQHEEVIADSFDRLSSPANIIAREIAIEISQKSYLNRDEYTQFSCAFLSQSQLLNSVATSPVSAPDSQRTVPALRTYLGKEVIPDSQDSPSGFDSNANRLFLEIASVGEVISQVEDIEIRNHPRNSIGSNESQRLKKLPNGRVYVETKEKQAVGSSAPKISSAGRKGIDGTSNSPKSGRDEIFIHKTPFDSQSLRDAQVVSPIHPFEHIFFENIDALDSPGAIDSTTNLPPSRSISYLETQFPLPPSLPGSPMSQPPASQASTPARGLSLLERLAAARRPFEEGLSAWKSSTPTPSHSLDLTKPSSSTTGTLVARLNESSEDDGQKTSFRITASQASSIPASLFPSQLCVSLSSLSGSHENLNLSQIELSQVDSYPSPLQRPTLQDGEYAVALPLNPDQQKAYLQNIKNSASIIQKFCLGKTGGVSNAPLVIKAVLDRASRLSTHCDLLNDEKLDFNSVSEQKEYQFALLHPKFKFLKALFDAIRPQTVHVAILAREGRTLDILEVFLRGIRIRTNRLDGFSCLPKSNLHAIDGSVTALLAATGEAGSRVLAKSVSLVIALDSTFDVRDRQVEKFRAHAWEVGRHAPVLHLVAANTVEHVDFYTSSRENLLQRMSYAVLARQHAGTMRPDYSRKLSGVENIDDNWYNIIAATIARSISSNLSTLELPGLPELSTVEDIEASSTQNTSVAVGHVPSSAVPLTNLPETETQRLGEKRTFSERSPIKSIHELDSKRQKTHEVVAAPSPQALDEITHVSDSMASQSQSHSLPASEPKEHESAKLNVVSSVLQPLEQLHNNAAIVTLQQTEQNADDEKARSRIPTREVVTMGNVQEHAPSSSAESSVPEVAQDDIEMQDVSIATAPAVQAPADDILIPWVLSLSTFEDATREELIERLKFTQQQLKGHISSTSRLTARFEEVWRENREMKSELANVKHALEKSEQRTSRLAEQVWNGEEENKQLRNDLAAARCALISSDKPDIAVLEQLRAENELLKGKAISFEKELREKDNLLQLIREQYDDASSCAAEYKKDMDALKEENEELKRKANIRAVELRKAQHDNVSKLKDEKIERLTRQLAAKDQKMRKLELALATSKGRAMTRSNSVNRASPSVSRTTSPGPGASAANRDPPSHALRNSHT